MYARLGFSVADVAQFLQVSTRTVHEWISGRVRIPFAAYKLLRVQLHYELPGQAWNGWHLSAGRLYTPEGYELHPKDFTWWGLLVRKAALFGTLYDRQRPPAPGGPRLRGVAGAVASAYAQSWPKSFAHAHTAPARSAPLGNHGEIDSGNGASLGPYCYAWPSTYVFHPLSKPLLASTASGSESALTRSSALPLTPICDSLSDRLSPLHRSNPPRSLLQVHPLPLPRRSLLGMSVSEPLTVSPSSRHPAVSHSTPSLFCHPSLPRPIEPSSQSGTGATRPSDRGV